jgi:hypothetical protein
MGIICVKGFVTLEKSILSRSPKELKKLLGFGPGRMSQGARLNALMTIPDLHQFDKLVGRITHRRKTD